VSTTNDILIVAEHEGGQAKKVALELATKAKMLAGGTGGSVYAVALGPGAPAVVDRLGPYGVGTVYVNDAETYAQYSIGPAAASVAALVEQLKPKLILFSATPTGKDVAARVSAKVGAGIMANALDVTYKEGGFNVLTSIFGGTLDMTKTFVGDGAAIVVLRPNAVAPEQVGGTAKAEALNAPVPPEAMLAKVIDRVVEAGAQAPLEEAAIICSGGRGVGGPEGFAAIESVAEVFGGVVGASRAAVDAGWISYSHQVGQTGKTVKPQLYVACGISGAIQHKVGMQTSSYIVAINKNPDAPIFQFADCCIVGDLFQIIPELVTEVKKRKQA
jgi:electron transfer flavoprotein alpha subunit